MGILVEAVLSHECGPQASEHLSCGVSSLLQNSLRLPSPPGAPARQCPGCQSALRAAPGSQRPHRKRRAMRESRHRCEKCNEGTGPRSWENPMGDDQGQCQLVRFRVQVGQADVASVPCRCRCRKCIEKGRAGWSNAHLICHTLAVA